MIIVAEINHSFLNFLKQEVIFEAQIKALQKLLSKKANEPVSKAYVLHLFKILNLNLRQSKLTSEGKESAINALNSNGKIILIPIKKTRKNSSEKIKENSLAKKINNENKNGSKRTNKNNVLETQSLELTIKREILQKYSTTTIQEIADELQTSIVSLQQFLKRKNLVKERTEKLSNKELEIIFDFISGKLKALAIKEKAEKRANMRIKKPDKSQSKSAGVFDAIHKNGGLGKIIYTK